MSATTQPDDILFVLLFETDTEMEQWLADKSKLAALKAIYPPRKHHCFFNKNTLQITITLRR